MTQPPEQPGDREPASPTSCGEPWPSYGPPPAQPYGSGLGYGQTRPPFVYGGRWRRLLAAVVDGLIVYAVTWLVTAPIAGLGSMYERTTPRQVIADFVAAAVAFPYYWFQHAKWGQTLGKRLIESARGRTSPAVRRAGVRPPGA